MSLKKLIEFLVALSIAFLIVAFFVYVVSYTPDTTKVDNEHTFGLVPNNPIALVSGKQKVVVVHTVMMKSWLESAGQKVKIVTITGIGTGSYGNDNFFLIVFEDAPSMNTINPELGREY